MKSYEIQELLNAAEKRLHELKQIIASSDEHALKCYKLGLVFEEEYPEDAAAYAEARSQYNAEEMAIVDLRAALQRVIEEEEREQKNEGEE